jgi:hypothetical protein
MDSASPNWQEELVNWFRKEEQNNAARRCQAQGNNAEQGCFLDRRRRRSPCRIGTEKTARDNGQ